jgi:phosphohistidine phosphatase
MELYILRHGEAGKRLSSRDKDFDRSLTSAGQKEVEDVSTSLKNLGVMFDYVITSPLRRAHQTAATVSKILRVAKKIETWNELKPEGNRLEMYKKLSQLKEGSTILVVGHEPYLSQMLGDLIFDNYRNGDGRLIIKKSGLARIRITSSTPKMKGELRWLLSPKLLKGLSKKLYRKKTI